MHFPKFKTLCKNIYWVFLYGAILSVFLWVVHIAVVFLLKGGIA